MRMMMMMSLVVVMMWVSVTEGQFTLDIQFCGGVEASDGTYIQDVQAVVQEGIAGGEDHWSRCQTIRSQKICAAAIVLSGDVLPCLHFLSDHMMSPELCSGHRIAATVAALDDTRVPLCYIAFNDNPVFQSLPNFG